MKKLSSENVVSITIGFMLVFLPGIVAMNYLKKTLTVGDFRIGSSPLVEVLHFSNNDAQFLDSKAGEIFSTQPYSFALTDAQEFEGCGCPDCCSALL